MQKIIKGCFIILHFGFKDYINAVGYGTVRIKI